METGEKEVTGTKKTVTLSVVGVVLVVIVMGTCIPSAREYTMTMTKALLGVVETLAK